MAYIPVSKEEEEYLRHYDAEKYPRPSVTVDILVFTTHETRLRILLIRRGGFPYRGFWAFPGGFLNMNESAGEAALRELREETGVSGIRIQQLATYSAIDRDPRARVISIAYLAMIPESMIRGFASGSDAEAAQLFEILDGDDMILKGLSDKSIVTPDKMAFDHARILRDGIVRMRGRLNYTEDAFSFLDDSSAFTVTELRQIHEAVDGHPLDHGNFSRMFKTQFLNSGLVVPTGRDRRVQGRPAAIYRLKEAPAISDPTA